MRLHKEREQRFYPLSNIFNVFSTRSTRWTTEADTIKESEGKHGRYRVSN